MSWYPSGLPPLVIRLTTLIDQRFKRTAPERPEQMCVLATTADLPPPAQFDACTVLIRDLGGGVTMPVFSDGAAWRRFDTGAPV